MKAGKARITQRVEEILRIRLDGAEFWDIRQYVREKEAAGEEPWDLPDGGKPISDSQLWRYMRRADLLVRESCAVARKQLLRDHLAKRRALYARAVNAGDFRTALAVLRDLAEMQRLYPDPAEDVRKDVEELKKQLEEAEAKRAGVTASGT